MAKKIEAFAYLRQKFPKISEAKMKEGIFIGPQINKLIERPRLQYKIKCY